MSPPVSEVTRPAFMAGRSLSKQSSVRNRCGSAGPAVREKPLRVAQRPWRRSFRTYARSSTGAGRGRSPREPKWPPETPRDLEALCEAAALPSPPGPSSLPSSARPVVCSKNADFLQRQQSLMLPGVDWGRYQVQVLFVDRSGTVRSRVAAGLMELIAEWNMVGGSIYADHAGTHADRDERLEMCTVAALLGRAVPLGVTPQHFTRCSHKFETGDFHRYDIIIALDSDVHLTILDAAMREAQYDCTSDYYDYLRSKVGLLCDFNDWCSDDTLAAQGPASLLPQCLLEQLGPKIEDSRAAQDVMRPDLQSPEGMDEWQEMNCSLVLGCASLTKYLIDALPEGFQPWEDLS